MASFNGDGKVGVSTGYKTCIPSVASSLNSSADGRNILSQSYQSGKYSESGSPTVRPFSIISGNAGGLAGTQHLSFESLVDSTKPEPQPIHLIYFDQESKQFKVSEDAKTFLSSIKERVGVISVAGKYRTGKSFLLNRVIINRRNQGFGVGPTINPCTKGLWLWGDTLQGEYQGEKLKVLLIDSEGIGAFDEDENHDSKIFLLALLLSSYFIYNSMGTIDENAINSLSLIIDLSKELQIKSEVIGESDPDEVAKYFPSFLWVVRDFSLRLHDTMGNQITPKEYLENAIQQQKGSSDQVETKNRIRRMIKHFFKDRDCFTLVRPVEEERELQNLQQMPDDQLRGEFVGQVNSLRTKIYKRVKPKTLNSKYITGEMLLELCNAYTTAINTGSVPNIQNAWSYVCQNECQRAITESITSYENEMRKVLLIAKEKCDEDILKREHRPLRDQAVTNFKQKAVGQDIQEFESTMRDGISKKYKDIKTDFLRACKQKALDFLDNDSSQIKKNLQNDMYDDFDKVKEAIELLKVKFMESGPRFTGRMEIFQEIQIALLSKAADSFAISSRKEQNQSLKRLQEKLQDSEKSILTLKEDHRLEKDRLSHKLREVELKLNDAVRNERVLDDRLKLLSDEKSRIEAQMNDKLKKRTDESEDQLKIRDIRIKSLENQLRLREDEGLKKSNEYDKLQALIEQKLALTEKELAEYKVRYQTKDQDCKELNKELLQAKKESSELQNKLSRFDQSKQDEIKALKQEHELQVQDLQRQINQGITGNPQVSEDQQQQWNRERQQLNDQLKSLTEGLAAQKQFQEHLMKMMSSQQNKPVASSNGEFSPNTYQKKINKQKEKNKELMTMNQNLSQQIVQMQVKQQTLEENIEQLKKYKHFVFGAVALQCRACNTLYPKEEYKLHLSGCSREVERASILQVQQNINPTSVTIGKATQSDKTYLYELQVKKGSHQWKLQRSLQEFKRLYDELYSLFPSYSQSIPFIQDEVLDTPLTNQSFYEQDLKQTLQKQLRDLTSIPFIRETSVFKGFLDFSSHLTADQDHFGYDPRRTMLNPGAAGFNSSFTRISHVQNPFQSQSNGKSRQGSQSFVQSNGNHEEQKSIFKQQQSNEAQILGDSASSTSSNHQKGSSRFTISNIRSSNMIQETLEDEEYSSVASANRLSELAKQRDSEIQLRPSVYSMQSNALPRNVKEYRPLEHKEQSLELDEELRDDLDEGEDDPVVQIVPNVNGDGGFGEFDATQRIDRVEAESFTQEMYGSKAVNPMMMDDGEDSFSKGLEDIVLSARRVSSTNPYENGSDTFTRSDISNTKVNLVGKFEAEALTHIKFNSTASAPASARKNNVRYEKTLQSEKEEDDEK